jgi:hypothetical protein
MALAVAILSAWAAGGCYSHDAALARLREDNPRGQTATIAEVVRARDTAMAGELIDLLDSRDEGVRFMAAAGLHRLTGRNFGECFAGGDERKAVIARWRQWWEAQQQGSGRSPGPAASAEPAAAAAGEPPDASASGSGKIESGAGKAAKDAARSGKLKEPG